MNKTFQVICSLMSIGIIAFSAWRLAHKDPTPAGLSAAAVTVRDRNDSVRIAIQAIVIEGLQADLKLEKEKGGQTEKRLRNRDATVKMLQSIIDTLMNQDSTSDSTVVPTFVADTITAKRDTIQARFSFTPSPAFSFRIGQAPIDTFVVARDSLITKTILKPTASPAELSVGVLGGMMLGIGVTNDKTTATITGGAVLLALTMYELLR